VRGVHRLGRTDRTLLWGTAALIAFTLGAVAVARSDGGTFVGADEDRLCYNSAGVGAACLPPAPTDFAVAAAVPSASASPAAPAPATTPPVTTAPPATTAPPTTAPPTTTAPTASKPATRKTVPAWAVGVAYKAGSRVSYQGHVYACVQPHTSQVDWSPVAAPALWSRVS
jgi:hypothetical protein